jgi:hypothetical protein
LAGAQRLADNVASTWREMVTALQLPQVHRVTAGIDNLRTDVEGAWAGVLAALQVPQQQLATAAAGLAPLQQLEQPAELSPQAERRPMTLRLEGPAIPPPSNPLAAARDREWQRFYRETALVAGEDGFRG